MAMWWHSKFPSPVATPICWGPTLTMYAPGTYRLFPLSVPTMRPVSPRAPMSGQELVRVGRGDFGALAGDGDVSDRREAGAGEDELFSGEQEQALGLAQDQQGPGGRHDALVDLLSAGRVAEHLDDVP